jgi:pimeloyl-ACP methyl ester carboxylesterase
MSSHLPLILLSGMGADHRLFRAQAEAFANVVTPAWLRPERNESLPNYARRLAAEVDPGGPCLVGGCSLGGMIALEMARYLQARACLLISSIRSPDQPPLRFRMLRPAVRIAAQPLRALPWLGRVVRGIAGPALGAAQQQLLEQLADADGRFLQWATWALLTWTPKPLGDVPIVQIHGTGDHLLPYRLTRPDVLIPGGGHALPITHPREVNTFLAEQMTRFG